MKTPTLNHQKFITQIESIAFENHYEKIIAKIPVSIKKLYINSGFLEEAYVPGFYHEGEDCSFVSKYINSSRRRVSNETVIEQVLQAALSKDKHIYIPALRDEFICRKAEQQDSMEMADFYGKIFDSYPFPIKEGTYIQKTMLDNTVYFGIWHKGILIALSSSEIDNKNKNAEMTDFAVRQDYRGMHIAAFLLHTMEQEMLHRKIRLTYSIARAVSYGMNCTFSMNGYQFAGTLWNNTQIAGDIESMNVWYKMTT
jgi:putative beta-lysine N-acetyltransferase